jgi:ATP-dependent RNA helicase DeaD
MEEETTQAAKELVAHTADSESEPTGNETQEEPTTTEESEAPSLRSFDEMQLSPEVSSALAEMGYAEPTDVQLAVYETIMRKRDVMVQARTGTGKTAAFGIPIVEMINRNDEGLQALILAPTRELALQVSIELEKIARFKQLKVLAVYGGAPMGKQIEALKNGAQVVAGTPGRVLDHIGRGTLKTNRIKLLVLDECDEMLSMGFQEEIEKIISHLPGKENRQTMLFSATIPQDIDRIARRHMSDPETISLSSDQDISVDQIDHSYYVVSGMARTRNLLSVIEVELPTSAIIFCNTREDTTTVAGFLQKHGYDAEAISSDLSQRDRERVMRRMRAKKLRFLVATDVAARGIDISDLSHVINYTFPESPEVYVHRTGRTGRAGNRGVAISLVGPREIGSFYYLKLLYKIRPQERELPSPTELATLREGARFDEVLKRVSQQPPQEFVDLARRLWQSAEGERVVGALLQELLSDNPRGTQGPPPQPGDLEPEAIADTGGAEPAGAQAAEPELAEAEQTEPGLRAKSETSAERPKAKRNRRRRRSDDSPAGQRSDRPGARARKSSGPSRGQSAAANAEPVQNDGREFWEAWADEKSESREPDDGRQYSVRLYVNVGRREQVSADEIRSLFEEWLGADAPQVGKVQVRNTHCYVRVPENLAERVINAAKGKSFKERELVIERART